LIGAGHHDRQSAEFEFRLVATEYLAAGSSYVAKSRRRTQMADGDDSDGNTTSEQEQQAEKERAEKDKAAERQAADEAKEIKRLRRASLILLASLVILGFASLATLSLPSHSGGSRVACNGRAASTSTVTTTPQAAKQAAADPSPIPARAAAADPAATPTSGAATSVPPRPFLNLGRGMIPEWLQIAAPYLIATVPGSSVAALPPRCPFRSAGATGGSSRAVNKCPSPVLQLWGERQLALAMALALAHLSRVRLLPAPAL
jgi:hypothetical protein